jgi:hypothetical protein
MVGGSDDHSSLNVARAFTEVKGADSVTSFLDGIENNQARVIRRPSSPQNLAHNIYSVAYQFYHSKFNLQRYVHKDILLELINSYLGPIDNQNAGFIRNLYFSWQQKRGLKNNARLSGYSYDLMRQETLKLIDEDPSILSIFKNGSKDRQARENLWFDVINRVSNRVLSQFANQLINQRSGANILNIFNSIASAGGMYTLLAPYFVAFSQHAKQRRFAHMLLRQFRNGPQRIAEPNDAPKTAIIADSFKKLKDTVFSERHNGKDRHAHPQNVIAITCDTAQPEADTLNIKNFDPIGVYEFSDHPGMQLFYPPIIDMLKFCYEQKIARIHVLTPGPLGLAGLLIARVLKLPIDSTYQNALSTYVLYVTQDETMEHLIRRYSTWFYNQMGGVYATSSKTAKKMVREGIQPEKIIIMGSAKGANDARNAKVDGFIKGIFQIPKNWKIYDNTATIKAAS